MSYEFNQGDSQSNEFPNPFKFENVFLGISAIALAAGGTSAILTAKTLFQAHNDKIAAVALAMSMLLLGGAVKFGIQALSQLRFFFGRKFPLGLAAEVPPLTSGVGLGADQVMETLRHRAVEFPEPEGALNGVLYSLVPSLATSPVQIQAAAVQHFQAVLGMVAVLFSLIVSYFMFSGVPHEGVMSWLYLPMTGLSLLTPFMNQHTKVENSAEAPAKTGAAAWESETAPTPNSMMWKLVGLVVFSIIAPVLIPRFVPAFPIPPMWLAPALLLIGSMLASALFLMSLFARLDNVTQTDVSCEQTTIAMNCPPAQLWSMVNRDFQQNWSRGIPNRAYANVPPEVATGDRGSFSGVLLEESQPEPTSTLRFDSLSEAMAEPYARFLLLLNAWGTLLSIVAGVLGAYYATKFVDLQRMEISRMFLIVIAIGVVTMLSFRIAHFLWSRIQFKSRLFWIETEGTFQMSKLSIGNQLTGQAQSSSNLTRIEDATLRVWVTDIVSVAFGKDGKRCIMALAPADSVARSMAERMKEFASEQSSIAAPTSSKDLQRANSIASLDATMRSFQSHAIESNAQRSLLSGLAGAGSAADDNDGQLTLLGTVKFFDEAKGFGFIIDGSGLEYYFNRRHIVGEQVVKSGLLVKFIGRTDPNKRGPVAMAVRGRGEALQA